MSLKDHPHYREEEEYLAFILSYIQTFSHSAKKRKKTLDQRVEYSIKHYNSDNADQFNELSLNILNQEYLDKKLRDMERALSKPYFSRIDFLPDDTPQMERLYIGKMSLNREDDHEILITDWRAPVSSLYYEGRLGQCSYTCEDGEISGELTLKRQYDINNGQLRDILDIDITANDDFLQAALGSSKDKRLKDIVTTIQAEQNRVIRADMFRNLVVQGAAGGGKTTIALHRIAYLLYTYGQKIKPKHIMIIAPNRYFISYISEVLPDLGVDNIRQTTFEDFACDYTGIKAGIQSFSSVLASLVETSCYDNTATQASHLKSSLLFKDIIEKYVNIIVARVLPDSGFSIEGFEILTLRDMKTLFIRDYSFMPIARRIEKLRNVLAFQLKNKKNSILEHIDRTYDIEKEKIKKQMPDSPRRRQIITDLLDERDQKLKEFSKHSKTAVKDFMARFTFHTPLIYYRILFEKRRIIDALGRDIFTPEELEVIISHSLPVLQTGELETDDLAPLLYLHYRLVGGEEDTEYKQIIIDEAQDFSLFQLWAMQTIMPECYFSILGDLSQGIYSYRGVNAWEDVLENIYPHKRPEYLTLVQSYRTTVEIMDKANDVISYISGADLPKANPVIRHGSAVSIAELSSWEEIANSVDEAIRLGTESGYQSMAVICKTMEECLKLRKRLKAGVNIITGQERDFVGGVMLLPVYLVKGLEFDLVCIANASAEAFVQHDTDIKLLYIAMTRALHSLVVFSLGKKSPLLESRN